MKYMNMLDVLDDVKVVLNEGMPHHRNPFDKGRLIINFKVQQMYMYMYMCMCVCMYCTCTCTHVQCTYVYTCTVCSEMYITVYIHVHVHGREPVHVLYMYNMHLLSQCTVEPQLSVQDRTGLSHCRINESRIHVLYSIHAVCEACTVASNLQTFLVLFHSC